MAIADAAGAVLQAPTKCAEDAAGYAKLRQWLGPSADTLVAMEATGHYWKNLFAMLAAEGFAIALLNPRRTSRFAQEELERTKTDALDAPNLARFAAQKQPAVDFGDRTRQTHDYVRHGTTTLFAALNVLEGTVIGN